MAKNRGRGPKGQALREGRSKLAVLKKQGLFTGNVRAAKLGGSQRALIRDFADVISGKAKVVNVPKADIKTIAADFRVRNKRVVLPVSKEQRVTYDARTKQFSTVNNTYGFTRREIIFPAKNFDTLLSRLPEEPEGFVHRYVVDINGNKRSYSYDQLRDQYLKIYSDKFDNIPARKRPTINFVIEESPEALFPGSRR